ncbi:MAG TPA: hypothetical protein VLB67_12165 [Acidimicrobiia bacterium]|nr:hypothetical protein [Acidimicrobiia bacterium]
MHVRRPRLSLLVAVGLVTAACTSGATTTTTSVVDEVSTTTTSTTTTEPNPTTTLAPPPCLSGTQPYVESGGAGLIERSDSDADTVSGIRWTTHEGCERIVVEFTAASGAPAVSPPGVGPLFIRSAGVVRLQLDENVTASAMLDQVVDTELVAAAYVVRRPTQDLFVDLHLAAPAAVRVSVASGPARIVVDVVPGGDPYPAPAFRTGDIVIVDPVGGEIVYPFTVNGYTRRADGEMTVSLATGTVSEDHTGAVGPVGDTWGAFTVLVPDGPVGPASMIVGGRLPFSIDLS